MNKKKGLVVWFTGLPCSGKTTLSRKTEKYFQDKNLPVQRLDGDLVRKTISSDLSFSKKDRDTNIKRISYVSQMLAQNGVNVVVAFVSPYQKMRDFARSLCDRGNFFEIYVKCSVEKCIKRDLKGMYAKALRGETKDFTGVQDPYEEPKNPDLVIETEKESEEESEKKIFDFLEQKMNSKST